MKKFILSLIFLLFSSSVTAGDITRDKVTVRDHLVLDEIADPGTAAPNKRRVYVDVADNSTKIKDDAGAVLFIGTAKQNLSATTDPTANEDSGDGYAPGSLWINVTADKVFICADATLAAAVWKDLSTPGGSVAFTDLTDTPGSISALQFLRGNSGGTSLEFTADIVQESDYGNNTVRFKNSVGVMGNATVAPSQLLGRTSSSEIKNLTATESRTILNVEDGADVTDATNVDTAGAVMESDMVANSIRFKNSVGSTANIIPVDDTVICRDSTTGDIEIQGCTPAETRSLLNVADGADVTDAASVAAAGAVMESDFAVNTFRFKNSIGAMGNVTLGLNEVPVRAGGELTNLTLGTNSILGREAGNIAALTPTEVRTIINVENGAQVTDATNVATAGAVMDSDFSATEGFMRKISAGTYEVLKSNLSATSDPSASDDNTLGYSIGSVWINISLDKVFQAVDVGTGTAVWRDLSTAAGGGGQWLDTGLWLVPNTNGDGVEIRDGTGADNIRINHDGTNAVIETNAGNVQFNDNITFSSTQTVDGRDVSVDGAKLDGIEALATADQTGAEIKVAYEAEANTNAFTDAEQTKLSGIESLADVTDATNVDAAGAVMDSDISPAEGFLRKTGAGAYTAIKSNLGAAVAPTINEDSGDGYAIGSVWLDTTADKVYQALDVTVGAAVWIDLSGAGGGTGLWEDNGDYINVIDKATDGVGIGPIAATDGTLHVHDTGSAGAVTAHAAANGIVLESNGNTGISILTPITSIAGIYFGDTDNDISSIQYNHSTNVFTLFVNGADRFNASNLGVVFNDTGLSAADFRIESDLNTHMFFVDAGNDSVHIDNSLLTGAGDGDLVMASNKWLRWINNAGSTSANSGINKDTLDNLKFHVPAVTDLISFNFAGTSRGYFTEENTGLGLLFEGESSTDHSAPSANNGILYTKDVGAETHLMFRNSTGVTDLLATGDGPLFLTNTLSGMPATTSETVLKTYTMPADTLDVDDKGIRIHVWGDNSSNVGNKTVRIKWGGVTILTVGPVPAQSTTWNLIIDVYRTGASAQNIIGQPSSWDNALHQQAYSVDTESLSTSTVIEATGQSSTASANSIIVRGMRIDLLPF